MTSIMICCEKAIELFGPEIVGNKRLKGIYNMKFNPGMGGSMKNNYA